MCVCVCKRERERERERETGRESHHNFAAYVHVLCVSVAGEQG